MRIRAPPMVAAAYATRWAIPPDSVCGYADPARARPSVVEPLVGQAAAQRRSRGPPAAARPRRPGRAPASSGRARGRAPAAAAPAARPHSRRRSRGRRGRTWSAADRHGPLGAPSSGGSVPIRACASTDLPEPLSPTMVSGRPGVQAEVGDVGEDGAPRDGPRLRRCTVVDCGRS